MIIIQIKVYLEVWMHLTVLDNQLGAFYRCEMYDQDIGLVVLYQ